MAVLRAGRRWVAAALACLGVAATGCSTSQPPAADGRPGVPATVTVYAAASMKATFSELGRGFEASHPGVKVAFNFAGSHTLAEQLTQGAPADVFASADEATMAKVTAAGLNAGADRVYATNRLSIAVPPDNPAGIAGFEDLAAPGVRLVICAPVVPCGAATAKLAELTGVTLTPVSEEQAVSDVLAKVQAGEADAGLVYRTDVIAAAGSITALDFPESATAINRNSIVALSAGPQPGLGAEFVELVLSSEGRRVLAAAGFGAAEPEEGR
ncbi:MAG: molybdate ABC transporter substrate-binding protein [Propionibacteriaceae bacterium]|nr:molybdate ABC transporter substrate-binding protein [Propionibacteriaceae bacterium]